MDLLGYKILVKFVYFIDNVCDQIYLFRHPTPSERLKISFSTPKVKTLIELMNKPPI